MKKPRADAKLKTLHPAKQEALWEMCQGVSYTDVVARLKTEWDGFETSEASLSAWYAWYPFSRELEEAKSLKDEIQEYLANNPDIDLDAEQVSKVSQILWEKRAAQSQDAKLFIELRKLRQKDRDQLAIEKKMLAAEADKIEIAMQAFYQEVRGNDEATELLDRVKALVRKQMDR